jgi:hypothetical protein
MFGHRRDACGERTHHGSMHGEDRGDRASLPAERHWQVPSGRLGVSAERNSEGSLLIGAEPAILRATWG